MIFTMTQKGAEVIDSQINSRRKVRMIKQQWTLLFAVAIIFSGCTNDATLRQKADELAHKHIILMVMWISLTALRERWKIYL